MLGVSQLGGVHGARGEQATSKAGAVKILGLRNKPQRGVYSGQRVLRTTMGMQSVCLPGSALGHVPPVANLSGGGVGITVRFKSFLIAALPMLGRSGKPLGGGVQRPERLLIEIDVVACGPCVPELERRRRPL